MLNNELKGKVVTGYQAWFKASNKLDEGWIHWSRVEAPSRKRPTFDLYPDTREYPDEIMFPTGYPDLGDGREAKLYSARTPQAIDLHFSWAKNYGIDCLALQRFYSETVPERVDIHYNCGHLKLVRESAEKHGRLFYIMYDFSGAAKHGDGIIEGCTQDWIIQVEESGLLESPNYACYNGKKIVCLWGFTGLDSWRYPAANNALALIKWFKKRGFYVIGGFPDNELARVTDDYAAVYRSVDMVSPWVVGRFGPGGVEKWWKPVFEREREFCMRHGLDYMPVAFPGFAWCNFKDGPANMIPRKSGEFFWEQIRFLHSQGIGQIYLAMMDEYDESTAFMKAAEDSTQIPMGDSYFQTLCVDGYWLSSDYYLRLANEAGRLMRGEAKLSAAVPISHSNGPVYWRNGFERRKYLNLTKNVQEEAAVDIGLFQDCVVKGDVAVKIVKSNIGIGEYALHVQGNGVYKIAPAVIHCKKPLMFKYVTDSDKIKIGAMLKSGESKFMTSGEVFTAEEEIAGIAVSIAGGEGYVDDIELREAI